MPNIRVSGWRPTGGYYPKNNKQDVFNESTIRRLCSLLHISFAENAEKYQPEQLDRLALITPEEMKQTAIQVKAENPELTKLILRGRGTTNNRCYLRDVHFTWQQIEAIQDNLTNDNGVFSTELLLKFFQKLGFSPFESRYFYDHKR